MKVLHYSDKGSKEFLDLYKISDILITTGDLRFIDFSGHQHSDDEMVYGNTRIFRTYGARIIEISI